MLLYTYLITARLQYITAFIGRQISDSPIELTTDLQKFNAHTGPKINYSRQNSPGQRVSPSIWIADCGFLSGNTIVQQKIECFDWKGHKAFFRTEGDIPFDIFAACFYLLSRYEEYLPHQKDAYGRYAHQNSLAFKENFLHTPLINLWLEEFKKMVRLGFPNIALAEHRFQFLPTYDIDIAYSYKYKGLRRSIGGAIRSAINGKWSEAARRIKVLRGRGNDPFDSYQWLHEIHAKFNLKPYYFFLLPDKVGKYDKNISPSNQHLVQLVKYHAQLYKIGIHPSWQSGDIPLLLKKEINTLEKIIGHKIEDSRQHYIRLTFPDTYRHLISAGITADFSMGYGHINGFRASVASPFYWYDLEKEQVTDLLLYPFCYMDANSFFEQKLQPVQALEEMKRYYSQIKAVNGMMVTIWHNTFLGTDKLFEGWREIYEQFLSEMDD